MFRALAAVCIAYSISLIPGNVSPLIVGGLISGLGISIADSGMILSCELITMGISATALSPLMSQLDARRVCLTGAVLQILGHLLAATASDTGEILLYRSLAGAGAGTIMAAVNATIAAAPNSTRLYGISMMAPPLLGALVAFVMSRAIASFAHTGAYGVLALLTLLSLPILFSFPDYRREIRRKNLAVLPETGPGVALLLLTFITGTSMMAYFAFVERMGVRINLSIEHIGNIFTIVVIAGALGAGIAALLGNRFGLFKPLLCGVLLHSISMIVVIEILYLPAYAIGTILEGITLVYILTFLFATAASLDIHGRWAAATGGAFSLSLGVGPYLGGLLIENGGYTSLTILIVSATIVIFLLWCWISQKVDLGPLPIATS